MMRSLLWIFVGVSIALLGAGFKSLPVDADQDLIRRIEGDLLCPEIEDRHSPEQGVPTVLDSFAKSRILILNYSAYDSAYANKARRILLQQLPASIVYEMWEGDPENLARLLPQIDAVVVPYPAGGLEETNRNLGSVLRDYVTQGGKVVFTGTHVYSVIQQYGLIQIDFGYFCTEPDLHNVLTQNYLTRGIPSDFHISDYAYPLDVSDPDFHPIAAIMNYPVAGFKEMGKGQVVYLGFEYYFNNPFAARLLANAVYSGSNQPLQPAGEGRHNGLSGVPQDVHYLSSLKIYPNPYVSKAALELDLPASAVVTVDMVDESGQQVQTVVNRMAMASGLHRVELPSLSPGIYFLQCRINEHLEVRKVVVVSAP